MTDFEIGIAFAEVDDKLQSTGEAAYRVSADDKGRIQIRQVKIALKNPWASLDAVIEGLQALRKKVKDDGS